MYSKEFNQYLFHNAFYNPLHSPFPVNHIFNALRILLRQPCVWKTLPLKL